MALKEAYNAALKALRPRGIIWNIAPDSITDKKLGIQAEAFARVHERADKLPIEANKKTTDELLEDWEDVYGLTSEGSKEDRKTALNIISSPGRQDIAFYEEILKLQGITATIHERVPFTFGRSGCGDSSVCGNANILFYWDIIIKDGTNEAVENSKKQINQYNQAHTILTFIDKRG